MMILWLACSWTCFVTGDTSRTNQHYSAIEHEPKRWCELLLKRAFPIRPSTNEGNTFGYDTASMVAGSCTLIWLRPLFKVKGRSNCICTQGAATRYIKHLTYQANCLVSRFPLSATYNEFMLGLWCRLWFNSTLLAVLTLQVILHLSQLWFNSSTFLSYGSPAQPWDHTKAVRMSPITSTCAVVFRERSNNPATTPFTKNNNNKKGCGARIQFH